MDLTNKHRNILLIASAFVLALAFLLSLGLEQADPNGPLVDMLRSRGYSLTSDQLYHAGDFPAATIQDVLNGVELQEAVEASLAGGFPSRVDAAGDVTLLLCTLGNGDVITLFLLDGEAELCFLQSLNDGSARPLDKEGAAS